MARQTSDPSDPVFRSALEDFWGRERHDPRLSREIEVVGHRMLIETNDEVVWKGVDLALESYSTSATTEPRYAMQIVVDERLAPGLDPVGRLPRENIYTGARDWLSFTIGPWGRAHVDLAAGNAVLIIGPDLAAASAVLARWVIHTIWTNLVHRSDNAMVHATALYRAGIMLCFVGTHNMGKSTTALHLAIRGGWQLLSDSQVYVDAVNEGLRFNAFPVGKVGLRRDMLDEWPELEGAAERLSIRDEHKYEVDLRAVAPERVRSQAVVPERVILCLIGRHDASGTVVRDASAAEVLAALSRNSVFLDTREAWSVTLAWLERLASEAERHHIVVGTDIDALLGAVDGIAGPPT